ncbi:MAG TPA: ammonia-forming cytochrome c nitrite reductase subunit c552 [Symbiobacteriaceae bacterium]|nr:ammonia-forming cytochrome c nitrite reductase subunit c552 [Symbiobacteriaceae bacterium]
MTRKTLKFAMLVSLIAILALTASVVLASGSKKAELPEYLGSEACVGCHAEKFVDWEGTGHAHMLTELIRPSDFPGDVTKAPEAFKAELQKAVYVVAGQRFVGRDLATGDLVYLNVQWNGKEYVEYKGGSNWNEGCAGCHATGYSKQSREFADHNIGCEACHGPGRDHILAHGDRSKITVTTDSQVCGQCHTGGTAKDGSRWPYGYRPGMNLSEIMNLPAVDPHGQVPNSSLHWRQYPLWQVSAHASAVTSLESSDHVGNYCYKCHSGEAFKQETVEKAGTFDPKKHEVFNAITCVACHDPHSSANPAQLRMESAQALCTACHSGSIPEGQTLKAGTEAHHPMKEMFAGYGAIGIAPTKGAHAELTCVECHMTEGNHLMKVIKPADVIGTTRKDTCSTCHVNSGPESRQVYLDLWQESVTKKLEAARADAAMIDAALQANPNALTQELKDKVAAAKTNLSFVEADGSHGAHNFEYAVRIVTAAQKDLATAKAGLTK